MHTTYAKRVLASCAAALLVITITFSSRAGVIETPPAPTETPIPASAPPSQETTAAEPTQTDERDVLAEATLSLVQTVLSLL